MRTITEVYNSYKIMPSLQMHMLRVAAVASMVCDNSGLLVDKNKVLKFTLLHDMGNIIKSNLEYFPSFVEPEGLAYWEDVKKEYIEKYGTDEHEATEQIMHELGVSEDVLSLNKDMVFRNLCLHAKGEDLAMKVSTYADMRVGPHGVLSYDERMEEGRKRYENRPEYKDSFKDGAERDRLVACGKDIENQLFKDSHIKPEDVNDESIAKIIEDLRSFNI